MNPDDGTNEKVENWSKVINQDTLPKDSSRVELGVQRVYYTKNLIEDWLKGCQSKALFLEEVKYGVE